MNPPRPDSPDADRKNETATMRALVNFNAQVLGITLGILCSLAIFVVTNFLILKGGPNAGAHLQLLSQFFYGYEVTFFGSVIGAVYGLLIGYLAGAIIAVIYNWVAYLRSR